MITTEALDEILSAALRSVWQEPPETGWDAALAQWQRVLAGQTEASIRDAVDAVVRANPNRLDLMRSLTPANVLGLSMNSRRSIRVVIDAVSAETGISRAAMQAKCRRRVVVRPRQIAMYAACKHTGRSLAQIARAFGDHFDHTTVVYARRKINELKICDEEIRNVLGRVEMRLASASVDEIERRLSE